MSKFLNNFQSTMSMAFHGIFAIIWLLLAPGIVFWGICSDLWIMLPVLALAAVLVLYKKKSEAWGGIIGSIINFFGGISAEDMQKALDNLSQANLIKDSGEGIKILKKCF